MHIQFGVSHCSPLNLCRSSRISIIRIGQSKWFSFSCNEQRSRVHFIWMRHRYERWHSCSYELTDLLRSLSACQFDSPSLTIIFIICTSFYSDIRYILLSLLPLRMWKTNWNAKKCLSISFWEWWRWQQQQNGAHSKIPDGECVAHKFSLLVPSLLSFGFRRDESNNNNSNMRISSACV